MKRKDLGLILVIVFISAIISLVVSRTVFGSPASRNLEAEEVQAITTNFTEPDRRYYNKDAFDPTRVITIGDNSNNAPFSGSE